MTTTAEPTVASMRAAFAAWAAKCDTACSVCHLLFPWEFTWPDPWAPERRICGPCKKWWEGKRKLLQQLRRRT